MRQNEFITEVTQKVAAHIAQSMNAESVIYSFTNNLLEQIEKISSGNPGLSKLQILSKMFAEDEDSNLFSVTFDELKGSGKKIHKIHFRSSPRFGVPKVSSIVLCDK